ncbi:hypothetical protein [Synechococcus sp. RedBA-s]|uniref:hypothetical protein n=1 Tax=Synechococcus sp. RedBA-s TaxID=2823741 RepID=UPI0020CB7E25|nr:hypothetical protein [Synechococcus sp. RedBA-s]MCP9799329.1 hypothetical protein [Synechococcus sp. RedBA-s]
MVVAASNTGTEASGKEGVVDKQVVITTWDHRESILRALSKSPFPPLVREPWGNRIGTIAAAMLQV